MGPPLRFPIRILWLDGSLTLSTSCSLRSARIAFGLTRRVVIEADER